MVGSDDLCDLGIAEIPVIPDQSFIGMFIRLSWSYSVGSNSSEMILGPEWSKLEGICLWFGT